jgi:hypothetical protein
MAMAKTEGGKKERATELASLHSYTLRSTDLLASHSRAGYWSPAPRRGQVHAGVSTGNNERERARQDERIGKGEDRIQMEEHKERPMVRRNITRQGWKRGTRKKRGASTRVGSKPTFCKDGLRSTIYYDKNDKRVETERKQMRSTMKYTNRKRNHRKD